MQKKYIYATNMYISIYAMQQKYIYATKKEWKNKIYMLERNIYVS